MNRLIGALAFALPALSLNIHVARAQPGHTGIPAAILAEVRSPSSLPPGVYRQVGRWTAAQLSHQVGRGAPDPDARSGSAWTAEASLAATSGAMSFGPYAEMPAGDYVAFFRLKLVGEIGDEGIATLDACLDHAARILATRELTPADLVPDRFVQTPLAFRSTGGPLECRVFWHATTSLTLDDITLFRREGPPFSSSVPRVEQPIPSGSPRNLKYEPPHPPFEGIFPRSSRPSTDLVVCDLRGKSPDVQFLAVSVQGLVNRSTPRVYCLLNAEDPFWLDWLRKTHRVTSVETVADGFELLKRFRSFVKGMVVTDPSLPATRNVATMVAGVRDAVIVSPRLARALDLPVLEDLRGRWKKNAEAYQWAYDTLWDRMERHNAACLWPADPGLRDYLIEHRIPVFWLPGRIDAARPYAAAAAEMNVMERMLARLPANAPMMGYPWAGEDIGMGEGPGVGLLAEFGKYLVGSPGLSNVSLHSGYPNPARRQPVSKPPALQRNKVYYSILISDGDNLPVIQISNWPQLWRDPTRGKLPLAWTISPASSLLLPDIVDYYYSTATPNDTFIAAVSGVGYTYPQLYGKRYTHPAAVYDGFLAQTATYMKAMDLRTINPSGVSPKEIARMAERLPGLKAIFADYGRQVTSYDEATTVTSRNVPVFHAVTGWEPQGDREQQIAKVVAQVKEITPKERPAFLHVFICNWFFDLPALQEIQNRLGPDYVDVSPDALAELCRQDMERKALYARMPTTVGGIEGRTIRFTVPLRNVTRRTLALRLKARVSRGAIAVRPSRVTLAPAQEIEVVISGRPTGSPIELSVAGPFGVRTLTSAMLLTPRSEFLGDAPPASAQYESSFEAESLPHIVGERVDDPTAGGGRAWQATRGQTRIGHLAYGPYRSYPAGRYVAIFRIKRTGEGAGAACTLDATVAGAAKSLVERAVDAAALPIGQWKSIALPFVHPGGPLETRVFWPGNASLRIDRIDLYTLGRG